MNLEKKFSVDLKNRENFITKYNGHFSNVYKIRDDNGEIYCGKFPKINNFVYLLDESVKKFNKAIKKQNISRFTNCSLYEAGVSSDIFNRFDLSMKPEGVYLVKVEGVDLFLPAFVNELAVDMFPQELSFLDYQEYDQKKNESFKIILKDGYYVWQDAFWDKNCFYSKEKGFKFNDFALWGKNGYFNPFVLEKEYYFRDAIRFSEEKKKELGII
ncbi:hypothetical protein GW932_04235 [archaeon]|nr:hypothetical protein [archaeon]